MRIRAIERESWREWNPGVSELVALSKCDKVHPIYNVSGGRPTRGEGTHVRSVWARSWVRVGTCKWVRSLVMSISNHLVILPLLLLSTGTKEVMGMEMESTLPLKGTITKEGSPLTLSCSSSSPWFFCLWHSPLGGKQCAIQGAQVISYTLFFFCKSRAFLLVLYKSLGRPMEKKTLRP